MFVYAKFSSWAIMANAAQEVLLVISVRTCPLAMHGT